MSCARFGVVLLTVGAALALRAPGVAESARHGPVTTRDSVRSAINAVRRPDGLRVLRDSFRLDRAASAHTHEMSVLGFFGHNSADGTLFFNRIRQYFPSAGYRYWSVGENLFWSTGTPSATDIVRAWMNSPPHRSILLARKWRRVGIGVVQTSIAPGLFLGLGVTIVTADFGVRY